MENGEKWYLKNVAGKVFGPIDLETLRKWVRDGRVEPLAGVSNDLQNWTIAPSRPELEMNWVVENNPGQFYGPTHLDVVGDLKKSGALSPAARFYCDDRGQSAQRIAAAEKTIADRDLELSRRDVALAEAQKTIARKDAQIEQEKKSLAQRDARLAEATTLLAQRDAQVADLTKTVSLRDGDLRRRDADAERREKDVAALKEELARRDAEIAELEAELARRDEVHQREWTTEVVVPEIVSDEPPPPVARQAFGVGAAQGTLAALEAQARKELARMGAAGAKKLFSFRKK
jgi:hypothetical protein